MRDLYDDVTVLGGAEATAGRVLSALDGAWLGHIAAHGSFRADSPMFSSLRMYDGPLTVYDFEQLDRAPYRLVLSSCDSGVQAPAGADELLGLVSSLLPLGTAGIVASVVPLNDYAVVPLMVGLHRYLRAGQNLAESMRDVRLSLTGDQLQQATATSLVALGAGEPAWPGRAPLLRAQPDRASPTPGFPPHWSTGVLPGRSRADGR